MFSGVLSFKADESCWVLLGENMNVKPSAVKFVTFSHKIGFPCNTILLLEQLLALKATSEIFVKLTVSRRLWFPDKKRKVAPVVK